MPINAYIMDYANVSAFLNNRPAHYFDFASTQNTTQGTVQVRGLNQGTYYLAIQNPSNMYGVDVKLEVVAIVAQ